MATRNLSNMCDMILPRMVCSGTCVTLLVGQDDELLPSMFPFLSSFGNADAGGVIIWAYEKVHIQRAISADSVSLLLIR